MPLWHLICYSSSRKSIWKKIKLYLKTAHIILLFIVIAYPLYVSVLFAVDPLNAQIADADHGQYVDSWAAGWGVSESVAFFKQQSANKKIFIATEGTFGLLPESLEMYLIDNKNITVKGYWPIDIFPKSTLSYAEKMPAYFVFYQPQHVVIPLIFRLD